MRIFYIRHAPTEANLTGSLVKNYSEYDILPFDKEKWFKEIGVNLPKEFKLFTSPSKRCIQTAKALFPDKPFTILKELKEFDCSCLEKNFWEVSEEEFTKKTHITKDIVENILTDFLIKLNSTAYIDDDVVVVGHGFYGRLLYSYWNGDEDTPLEILNSKNFKFKNLDMMYVKMAEVKEVYRFDKK